MDESGRADEQTILELWQRMEAAWQAGDAEAWADCYWENSDYVTFDGSWLAGRDQNVQLHAQLFRTVLRGTRLEGKVERLRFLSAQLALVHSTGAVIWPWQRTAGKKALSRQTTLMEQRGGVWKVAAFHNTRIRPVPPMPEGSLAYAAFRLFVGLRTALARSGRGACALGSGAP